MEARLSRWGVGPKIALGAGAYCVLAVVASRLWPGIFEISFISPWILNTLGGILCTLGLPLWLAGIHAAMSAYNRDELMTSGVFGLVRHPIYAAWIVFLLPGIALLCQSWLLFGASLTGYAVFKLSIRREDDYLAQRFGQAYLDYRSRVNELVPWPSRL
jgi:protein-S-isoprenylcysteine O-methyltransferase Ste14